MRKLHSKTPVLESPFNKVVGLPLYLKETPTQVFSYEIYVFFKNTYFEEHLRTTASLTKKIGVTE